MRKLITACKISLIFIIIVITLQGNVLADKPKSDDTAADAVAGVISDGWGYFMQDDTHMDININWGQSGAESTSKTITEKLLGVFQAIGSVISVIALVIIGFRYMFSSLEEKAQMKGVLIYYVIGAVLVFATSNILSIVYNAIKGVSI